MSEIDKIINLFQSKKPIYLLIGIPGSGKSWICNQIKDRFDYIPHDKFKFKDNSTQKYLKAILNQAKLSHKPILIETPFTIDGILNPLKQKGFKVNPIFIMEDPKVISLRYFKRENKPIPKGHLTRLKTYKQRAKGLKAFSGTSEEVLNYFKQINRKNNK